MICHSSACGWWYKFIRSFEAHNPYDCCSDGNEDNAHNVEVERPPVVDEEHARVACEEHYHVYLLSLV